MRHDTSNWSHVRAANKRAGQPVWGSPQRQRSPSLQASALLSKHLVQAKMEAADSARRLKWGLLTLILSIHCANAFWALGYLCSQALKRASCAPCLLWQDSIMHISALEAQV